ncbi:Coenzyme F420 hydrogenase/dehydrogenase, beta subunit C-terminal domain [Parabacteroides sp. ZJ-118]|uniref:Coenzyme F420 hydrogenase/dehydrogenase, beta subunit C-terminal domain n=1 Tax=Parabacteroides sp. ZJ-118 TaxID=2709398 RepID=UPI0013EA67B3|nr:Coenzyme F420 hydrogenase/dehydrogenase, beta subunit C-terminal domain [Parabacteroides sp. ZJ-118]
MRKNILADSQISCTGCGACVASCHKKAITLSINEEGFYAPVVDGNLCVDCGACQKVCYRFIAFTNHTCEMRDKTVYGVYSSNQVIQHTTTSGGCAYELSLWGIDHGYKIMGVIYDYEKDQAKTVLISQQKDLELLKGSKYIQSDTSEAFALLLEEAKKDQSQKYICIGTPCQIFGLRQLIRRHHLANELILVDLFCHGVPSYNVWKPYISQKRRELGKLNQVQFRHKGNGWHQYTIRLLGEKGIYSEFAYKDMFYRYFFDNVALNTSCFTCALRKEYVASDLRLGDFLGGAYEQREDGVSAALVATDKGDWLLKELAKEKRIIIDREWLSTDCLKAQSTCDYLNLYLRDKVIMKLRDGEDLGNVQHFYFRYLPFKNRLRSYFKRLVTFLPPSMLMIIRRFYRAFFS